MGLSEEEKEVQDRAIHEVEEKWRFCGGRDIYHEGAGRYSEGDEGEVGTLAPNILQYWEGVWKKNFPDQPMPAAETVCVCQKRHLRYNCYITDGTTILVVGRVCIIQFIPRLAKEMVPVKRCDLCEGVHRNRKDNYCTSCRPIVKAMEEEERELIEAGIQEAKRLDEERAEAEKRRIAQEALMGTKCACGGNKRSGYTTCWPCHAKITTCLCGKSKRKEYATCFECHVKKNEIIFPSNPVMRRWVEQGEAEKKQSGGGEGGYQRSGNIQETGGDEKKEETPMPLKKRSIHPSFFRLKKTGKTSLRTAQDKMRPPLRYPMDPSARQFIRFFTPAK